MTNEELNLFELDFEYELLGNDLDAFKAIVDDYVAAEPTDENNDDLRRFFFSRSELSADAIEMITYAVNTLAFEATAVPLAMLVIKGQYISTLKAFKKTAAYALMSDENIAFYNQSEKGEYMQDLTSKALQFRDRAFIKEVRTAVARMKDIDPIQE